MIKGKVIGFLGEFILSCLFPEEMAYLHRSATPIWENVDG